MSPGCRIGRVRLKGSAAHLSVLATPAVEDEHGLIRTLVWVLDKARRGEVSAFAMTFVVEDMPEPGYRRFFEAAAVGDENLQMALLGSMRRMEANFLARENLISGTGSP